MNSSLSPSLDSSSSPKILEDVYNKFVGSISELEKSRLQFISPLPSVLEGNFTLQQGQTTSAAADAETIAKLFPKTFGQKTVLFKSCVDVTATILEAASRHIRIGIVLSGGPAPGGHNVICGLYDYLKRMNPKNELFGFLDGPQGIIKSKFVHITKEICLAFMNQGGFHMIGSGRGKIESAKEKKTAPAVLNALDGLVVVGGDDSNTKAAILAEYFVQHNSGIKVCGVPKTIDGDLRNEHVEISFGFDTSTKVYSERVAALCADAASARKSYHICRLMGRTASHITLEVGLQVHPNITLIGEEIKEKKMGLREVVNEMADVVCQRALLGRHYGVFILPEGLVDFLPDMGKLLDEINDIIAHNGNAVPANLTVHLSEASCKVFESLPSIIAQQLLLDRDDHGNVQVSQIESERLLASMLSQELAARKKKGDYEGSFKYICHFLGYEGRCGLPSTFDATYCYALGATSAVLIAAGYTGMMAIIRNICLPINSWECGGMPLTHMMNIEKRHGKDKPVIRKALVELDSLPFLLLKNLRDEWKHEDRYRNPGPIQFGKDHSKQLNLTLQILQHHYRDEQQKNKELNALVDEQKQAQKQSVGTASLVLDAIRSNM